MDQITSQNERLLDEVFAEDFSSRLVSLDEMISRSENITTQFRSQVRVSGLIAYNLKGSNVASPIISDFPKNF